MCIGDGQAREPISEDGNLIKHCTDYKYLGIEITQDKKVDEIVKEKNRQGERETTLMNSIMWDENMSKPKRRLIYNTIINSVVTYNFRVWQLKKHLKKTLEATKNVFLETLCRKTQKGNSDQINKLGK